jgi:alpha-mannosidase
MSTTDADPEQPSSEILQPYAEPPAAEPAPEPPPEPPRSGRALVALIPDAGREPSAGTSDAQAQAIWCAVSALWHPSLLTRAAALPRIESITAPTPPEGDDLRLIVHGMRDRLPSGYATQAEDAGAVLLESGPDRDATVREIQERLGIHEPETPPGAEDFLALGMARWMVRDLTASMGRPEALKEDALAREALAAADAWAAGDAVALAGRLKSAFEILTQAREAVYSVDAYLVDLCLLDPALPAGGIATMLAAPVPFTFLAQARAIEAQAKLDPDVVPRLGQAITDGWVDVIGGAYDEAEDPLLPVESALWQFRKGGEIYREHLDDRNVETYARRRFGLWPQIPMLSRRSGYRFALHLGLDGGRFPIRREPKRIWESPDGSSVETLFRTPLAADRASHGLTFPWKLAATMRTDTIATLPMAHWPSPVASWYRDLRRVAAHSPVFGRWTTVNDYFQLTDRPYETFRPEPDDYTSPYLSQAAATREERPISRFPDHHRLRARLESARWLRTMAKGVNLSKPDAALDAEADEAERAAIEAAEAAIETRRHIEAAALVDALESDWAAALVAAISGERTADARPGYLVFNPIAVARKVAVVLPDASPDLRPEGALVAAQLTDEGVVAVVDLPAFGFAWVPRETAADLPPAETGLVSANGRVLKNESIEIEFDETAGGVRGIMAIGESTARLAQQTIMTGLKGPQGEAASSRMRRERFEVEFAGPALAQAVSTSALVDPAGAVFARIDVRCRLWVGRPIAELELTVRDLDPTWADWAGRSDPWSHHLACRWAWPDGSSMVRRLAFLSPETTHAERPETPDAIDVSTRRQRAAMLFGGLPYHKKAGARMLDTLLVAGSEEARTFRLGVTLDSEHPHRQTQDFLTPAIVAPTDAGPPPMGERGWLMRTDSQAVAVTHVGFIAETYDGRGWGIDVHLVETAGYHARCRVQFFRDPTWARQYDLQGESIGDLSVDGDAVWLDLMAGELFRMVVAFG